MRRSEPRVLVAVRDQELCARLAELLEDYGPQPAPRDSRSVLEALERWPSLWLLIVEESSSDRAAFELVDVVKQHNHGLAVIVLSSDPTIEHATEAIRRGAEDFVPVPFSGELLRKEVQRILDAAELRDRIEKLHHLVSDSYGFDRIISSSAKMRTALERARAGARTDTPVLITGETGTGKELVARAVHANSRRREGAFVAINCAALPRDLLESELFGHRRGAFSGAHTDYPGLFVAAHRGTLFLDEIGELSTEGQAKLLRALQDGEIRPVGGLDSRHVDVRVIAATNRKLTDLPRGVLREDLFFRLSVLVIDLPPLRERLEDIPLLIAHFLARMRSQGRSRVEGTDSHALELMLQYPFPGNVRELENLLEGICATLPAEATTIPAESLRAWLSRRGLTSPSAAPGGDIPLELHRLEGWAIREALRRTHGNKTKAAELLGISRDTLYRKLNELEMQLSDLSDSRTTH